MCAIAAITTISSIAKWRASNSKFVSDEVVDRFCLVGPAEAHREKLRKLASVGVTQFNVYLMCGEEEDTLEEYKKEMLPAFRNRAVNHMCSSL